MCCLVELWSVCMCHFSPSFGMIPFHFLHEIWHWCLYKINKSTGTKVAGECVWVFLGNILLYRIIEVHIKLQVPVLAYLLYRNLSLSYGEISWDLVRLWDLMRYDEIQCDSIIFGRKLATSCEIWRDLVRFSEIWWDSVRYCKIQWDLVNMVRSCEI